MERKIELKFENKLLTGKRDLNIYHRDHRGTHLISCGSTVSIPLKTISEEDYINLSVAVGPGYMEHQSVVDLPSWLDYEVLSEGRFGASRCGDRTRLKFPAGLPEWTLKITLSTCQCGVFSERVIINDGNEQ